MRPIENKWAILVGVSEYGYVRSLKYCVDDVEKISVALRDHLGFNQNHICKFSDTSEYKPTVSEIWHQLSRFCESGNIKPNDLLVFYFTGHGMINDGVDYLLPKGASPLNLPRTAIKVQDIVDDLKKTKCENIVMFLDACREAIDTKSINSIGECSKSILKRAGIITFFSCDPKELSYEIDELKNGAFTHCILKAIINPDIKTISQLYGFLLDEVPRINSKFGKPLQKPYAIIEPDEFRELSILANIIGTADIENYIEQLTQKLERKEIDISTFSLCADILERVEKGKQHGSQEFEYLIQYLNGKLGVAGLKLLYKISVNKTSKKYSGTKGRA